jgi:crossover junction endodeoxyribonuclease RuvC
MGVDAGLTGGIALLSDEGLLAERMPVVHLNGKGTIDLAALGGYMASWAPDEVWLEEQQAMPKQGVSSTFRTGLNYGILVGYVSACGIPLRTVRPAVWKKAMGVPADKDAARAIASRLFPKAASCWRLKNQDGVAEAALIALYGAKEWSI